MAPHFSPRASPIRQPVTKTNQGGSGKVLRVYPALLHLLDVGHGSGRTRIGLGHLDECRWVGGDVFIANSLSKKGADNCPDVIAGVPRLTVVIQMVGEHLDVPPSHLVDSHMAESGQHMGLQNLHIAPAVPGLRLLTSSGM
jgi:hypothetical protein